MKLLTISAFATALILNVLAPPVEARLEFNAVYDFGHVGIDFKVYHSYPIINSGDKPVKITDLDVTCDCTSVSKTDSIIYPGDSVLMTVEFETKNYYGPTNKTFIVRTDDSLRPEIKFFYLSIVGQWFNGIKPDPLSLFFLPANQSKTVSIPNVFFDEIRLTEVKSSGQLVDIVINRDHAAKGESLEISVSRKNQIPQGTSRTSITLRIAVPDDDQDVILTVPIKIVSY